MLHRYDISQQIAQNNAIETTSDAGRLLVSRLTLETIGNILLYEDLETISRDDLSSFKDEMSNILQFCHLILDSELGERLAIASIIPLINRGNTHLLSASSLAKRLDKEPENYELYYKHLQNFRDAVLEIKEQLDEC